MKRTSERRQEIRERVSTPVLYRLSERTLLQNSYDISAGGISVMCPYRPDVGSSINLRFTHPRHGSYIHADGRVVYVFPTRPDNSSNRLGIRFSQVTQPALAEIFSS